MIPIDAHDRTGRLAETIGVSVDRLNELRAVRIVLEIGDVAAMDRIACLAYLTLCNLVTRLGQWAPSIEIQVPARAITPSSRNYKSSSNLRDQTLSILRESFPPDGLHRGIATGGTYDLAITIGQPRSIAKRRIHVGWNKWLARVAPHEIPTSSDGNPLGAFLAVAMATARLHGHQVDHLKGTLGDDLPEFWSLSAYAFDAADAGPSLPTRLVLPRTLMVGAGALASTLSYAVAHVPNIVTEGVDTVDHDVITKTSANRQITAPYSRAQGEDFPKVEDLKLTWPGIQPHQAKYTDWKNTTGKTAGDYAIVITAVDSSEVRREVAGDLPGVIIDGATGGLAINVLRVDSPERGCLRCEYPAIVTDAVAEWSVRLGYERTAVEEFRAGTRTFDETVLTHIGAQGTLELDDAEATALKNEGWSYLVRRGCGSARPDRELPHASASYISATCGFLMAAQLIKESLPNADAPLSYGREKWEWDNLFESPATARVRSAGTIGSCTEKHAILGGVYRKKHGSPRRATDLNS